MNDIVNFLSEINNNLLEISNLLQKEKTIFEKLLENGILVLIASLGSLIVTNLFNKSENKKTREFEIDKLNKEYDSNLQTRREEILITKYDSIVDVFKKYRLEYHSYQNEILTIIKIGRENNASEFGKEILVLKEIYSSFSKLHTEQIGSLKVDLSLLKLNDCKIVINDIERIMVGIFDLTRLVQFSSDFLEIASQFDQLNKDCYEKLILFMEVFSEKYLRLYKLTEKDNGREIK